MHLHSFKLLSSVPFHGTLKEKNKNKRTNKVRHIINNLVLNQIYKYLNDNGKIIFKNLNEIRSSISLIHKLEISCSTKGNNSIKID